MRPRSALLFHEAGDGAHEVVFGEDLETSIAHFDKDRRVLMAEEVGDALDGCAPGHLRQRLAHYFAEMQPPPEPPVNKPSSFARRRATTKHSSSFTWMMSSRIFRFMVVGKKSSPIPSTTYVLALMVCPVLTKS